MQIQKKMLYLFIVIFYLFFSLTATAKIDIGADEAGAEEIKERLSPFTHSCKQGEPCANLASYSIRSSSGPRTGKDIYNSKCSACHSIGVGGAPKKGNSTEWKAHFSKHNNNFHDMLQSAIKGVGLMPPKGNCVDCSDEELTIAIEYMSGLKSK